MGRPSWRSLIEVTELWASLAIVVIWLAVLFDAVFGPNIVADGNNVGGGTTVVPWGSS